MRAPTPRKLPKHLKIGEKQPKNTQNYLYISIFLWTRTGELRTRPRRAETRAWESPNPKTRTLGPTPSIFCKVDAPRTPKTCLWRPPRY